MPENLHCQSCEHFAHSTMFDAVVMPPNGQILPEEQYNKLVSSGQIPPGLKGIIRSKVSQCTVFPKHEMVPASHFCGQHTDIVKPEKLAEYLGR